MTVRTDEDPALPTGETADDALMSKLQAIFDKTAKNKLSVEGVPCEVESVETLFTMDNQLTLRLHLVIRIQPPV